MDQQRIILIYERLRKTQPTFVETDNDWIAKGLSSTPFKALVSVAISTMTTEKRTIDACTALYDKISTPQQLLQLEDEELSSLIKPAAHYNRKTKNLKKMCQQLIERHNGEVPCTRDELLALTGVGRKCTDILMHFTFSEPTIAVDTHVHRVVNRLGMTHTISREDTADAINQITPLKFKHHAHEWIIQHGMKICIARKPKCSECSLTDFCDHYQNEVK
ncbi:endonuclease III domain-containing protein [Paenibacillus sp. USHLN196]|uniref:endonuclease III domain-containing protein n=1 Tax=Paenibacillus sp. USHLN196 TaxID=3081291 RepID=UPI0030166F41